MAGKPISGDRYSLCYGDTATGRNSVTVPLGAPAKFVAVFSSVPCDPELCEWISEDTLSYIRGNRLWEKRVERIIGEIWVIRN